MILNATLNPADSDDRFGVMAISSSVSEKSRIGCCQKKENLRRWLIDLSEVSLSAGYLLKPFSDVRGTTHLSSAPPLTFREFGPALVLQSLSFHLTPASRFVSAIKSRHLRRGPRDGPSALRFYFSVDSVCMAAL